MKQLSREKLALLFFIFLILFGLGISLFYISSLSTPLNVAASNIDDAAGTLEDYTAIVYEGLAEEKKDQASSSSANKEPSEDLNKRSQNVNDDSSDELTASEALPDTSDNEEEKSAVTVRSVRKDYVEKGAAVFELNVADPSEYNTRSVVRAGKYTFGILSVNASTAATATELEAYIQKRVKEYEAIKIDFVVLVVSDLDVLMTDRTESSDATATQNVSKKDSASADESQHADKPAEGSAGEDAASSYDSEVNKKGSATDTATKKKQIALKGVDIVISTQDEGLNSGGVMVDGIFYNDAPLKNEVGTLLISPSRVISAKDVS